MPSTFAWLAVDAEQRRRMMEAVDQFRDETTIDDLGVGAIRDAFSDTLFPGTSTLNTRLRYVLFIPWLMREASKRPTVGEMAERYHDLEREFISALERGTSDDEPGIIGRRAGKTLQRVPSVVYGGMLAQWGILERGLTSREFFTRVEAARRLDAEAPRTEDGGLGTERIPDGLDPALPAPPDHLLRSADFRLLPGEVEYLREAITRTNPGTLIARLVQERPAGWTDAQSAPSAPWAPEILDLLSPRTDGELRTLLDLAERFSLHVHGANLLYNLRIAEETASDPERFRDDRVAHFRELLESWADETAASRPFDSEDLLALGQLMAARRRNFTDRTRTFLESWCEQTRTPHAVADSTTARHLITQRERLVKQGRARLRPGNLKALNAWSGASGAGRNLFRWPNVVTLLQDLYDAEESA
ncbi:DUF6361 family protein [Brachybacterium halotolerans subsp. kimchii]|uniref:DUF6361 family protein n=1 Tax=Brachybacterium halotolerans TaxID=2795215 RepID=UPI001E3259AA|nr:DUF6361 family protein [Brachybacterium halotolerans]UEJ81845.1 DUF6361 family protein [Brachybacterium halotolerans subsp. kimchii]